MTESLFFRIFTHKWDFSAITDHIKLEKRSLAFLLTNKIPV